jgi:hypothetical protein
MTLSGNIRARQPPPVASTELRRSDGNRPAQLSTLKAPHLDLDTLYVNLHVEQPLEGATSDDRLNTKQSDLDRHIGHVIIAHRPQLFWHAAPRQARPSR